MAAGQTLSAGQRLVLQALAQDGRIWKSPKGCQLVSPYIPWANLTDATVDALLAAGYLQLQEGYGSERAVYVLSPAGAAILAVEHA